MAETDNPFEKMLDRLREKGWKKGDIGPPDGPYCIVGAAHWGKIWVRWDELTDIILSQFPDRNITCGFVDIFNDHPDTTFADVERVLEKAAVKWEEERVMRDD